MLSSLVSAKDDLLFDSFMLHLKAENKTPATIRSYADGLEQFAQFLIECNMPTQVRDIRREHVESYVVHLTQTRRPSTASTRYCGLHAYFSWLEQESEVKSSPMARMRAPKVPPQPVETLKPEEVAKLIAACKGNDFADRRDSAIIRMLFDCGLRSAELLGLAVADVNLKEQVLVVTGKGGSRRPVPFGARTAASIDRYLRARRQHWAAGSPKLWLGHNGELKRAGLYLMVKQRGRKAGLGEIHPHQLRHSLANAWLVAGGTEADLMAIYGWKSRAMLQRYDASLAAQRAIEAHKRLSPGDRL